MTKKDYVLIADALCLAKPDLEHKTAMEAWRKTVVELGYALSLDNPRFDAVKFVEHVITGG